ncbi:Hypothetical predicted protein [Olea europaea subsp. europaea]|uniref:Uncharacterized protein n=1 Tax=Olea europaea subsp. europaea TaxID=158383 RepID=A0A8S0RWI9_OLEEU|nr:Hypothetical predicted protein [Olea europaea subsp. europaea]
MHWRSDDSLLNLNWLSHLDPTQNTATFAYGNIVVVAADAAAAATIDDYFRVTEDWSLNAATSAYGNTAIVDNVIAATDDDDDLLVVEVISQ